MTWLMVLSLYERNCCVANLKLPALLGVLWEAIIKLYSIQMVGTRYMALGFWFISIFSSLNYYEID